MGDCMFDYARPAFVLFAGLCFALPAAAQDGSDQAMSRTPANAQRFIASFKPTSLQTQTNGQNITYAPEGDVTSDDVCVTRFAAFPTTYQNGAWVKTGGTRVDRKRGLGFTWAAATDEQRRANRLAAGMGLVVTAVTPGSIAEQQGLRPGLVIQFLKSGAARVERLEAELAKAQPGDKLLFFFHGGMFGGSAAKVPLQETVTTHQIQAKPETISIEWSKVEEVLASDNSLGTTIFLRSPAGSAQSATWLTYNAKLTGDRIFAAAQYLKDACDRSKELGF
jgi:hypothetical protein